MTYTQRISTYLNAHNPALNKVMSKKQHSLCLPKDSFPPIEEKPIYLPISKASKMLELLVKQGFTMEQCKEKMEKYIFI